jgi:hypothetical protein
MAVSYILQPASIKGALSSMLYQAYDTDYAQPDFYYEYKIYVWSGIGTIPATPIVTIQRLPDVFAGYRSSIEISKIVAQYIKDNYFIVGTAVPTIGQGAVYCVVKVQGIWTGGSSTQITSNTILATKGYEYTLDGFNSSTTKTLLTDRTTIYMTEDTAYDYLWYKASNLTSIVINGTPFLPAAISGSNEAIQGLELRAAITSAATWGTDLSITINYVSGSPDTIPVVFDCTNKYGCTTLFYKNRYGVIEAFSMNALSKVSTTTTKEEYYKGVFAQSDMSESWSYGVPIKTLYNIQAIYKQVANTNWLTEEYVEIVQQILLSSYCSIVYDGVMYACQVVDSAMERKTYKNDKLIMYTMNFEFAQPLINSIVR